MRFLPSQVQYLSRRMLDHDQASYTMFTNVAPVEIGSVQELMEHPQVKQFCTPEFRQFCLGSDVRCWDDLDNSISLFVHDRNGELRRVGFLFEANTDEMFQARTAANAPLFVPIGSNL